MLCKLHYTLPSQREFGPPVLHPVLTVARHLYLIVSFSDCVRSAVMTLTSTSRQHARIQIISLERERNEHRQKSRAESLKSDAANNTANNRVPFVTTFHPGNLVAGKIISRNFLILREDSTTSNIFNKPPLEAFRRAKNLKPRNLETFHTNHQVLSSLVIGPFAAHVPMSIHHPQLQHPKGMLVTGHFSCITENVVYCLSCTKCPSTVYNGETRLDAGWRTALESTAEMSSNNNNNN